jgi:hypothetical protein
VLTAPHMQSYGVNILQRPYFFAFADDLLTSCGLIPRVTPHLCCQCATVKGEKWNHCLQAASAHRLRSPSPPPPPAALPSTLIFCLIQHKKKKKIRGNHLRCFLQHCCRMFGKEVLRSINQIDYIIDKRN